MVSLGRRSRRLLAGAVLATACAAATVPVAVPAGAAAPRADLTVVRTTAPASVQVGEKFGVDTGVRNAGLRKSRATTVEYYLSENATKDRGDRKLSGSTRLKALIGGVSHDVRATLKVPSGTVPGTYYVIACVARTSRPTPGPPRTTAGPPPTARRSPPSPATARSPAS
jgi:hypothetical protein